MEELNHNSAEQDLSVFDHLAELRRRLIIIFSTIAGLTAAAYWKTDVLFHLLKRPLEPYQVEFAFFTMTEAFANRIKTALAAGIVLSVPVIYYHLMAFIGPGLTDKEKKLIRSGFLTIVPLLLAGTAFGYLFLAPRALQALFTFGSRYMLPVWSGDRYIVFLAVFCLSVGMTFAVPILLVILGKLGLLSSKRLRKSRIAVILLLFAGGGMMVGDAVSALLLAAPFLILYEISIWIVKRIERRRAKTLNGSLDQRG